jgi:D-glycero-D-manno-heptose 1,7-bisphosphate phosphatase
MSEPIRQAFILVGGKGTRLEQATRNIPKPLVEIVDGVVFLDFLLEQLARYEFNEIVLLAGHLGHLVRDRYHHRISGKARVQVLTEPSVLGTGGALLTARNMIASPFLLLNGDSFFDINLRSLAVEAQAKHYEALIALHEVAGISRYGVVDLEGGRIVRFREKTSGLSDRGLINAGIYVLTPAILDHIRSLPCSIELDVFPSLAREGRLWGSVCDGYFVDIGLPETLEQARRQLPSLQR